MLKILAISILLALGGLAYAWPVEIGSPTYYGMDPDPRPGV